MKTRYKGEDSLFVRLTCWVPREIYDEFNRVHPVRGAITTFIQKSMQKHLALRKQETERLLEDDKD